MRTVECRPFNPSTPYLSLYPLSPPLADSWPWSNSSLIILSPHGEKRWALLVVSQVSLHISLQLLKTEKLERATGDLTLPTSDNKSV